MLADIVFPELLIDKYIPLQMICNGMDSKKSNDSGDIS